MIAFSASYNWWLTLTGSDGQYINILEITTYVTIIYLTVSILKLYTNLSNCLHNMCLSTPKICQLSRYCMIIASHDYWFSKNCTVSINDKQLKLIGRTG